LKYIGIAKGHFEQETVSGYGGESAEEPCVLKDLLKSTDRLNAFSG
jgi:hypothetical protein